MVVRQRFVVITRKCPHTSPPTHAGKGLRESRRLGKENRPITDNWRTEFDECIRQQRERSAGREQARRQLTASVTF